MATALLFAAAVQAVAAVLIAVLTVLILGVYRRQREIMDTQAHLLCAQTELQREQQRLSELLATSEFAPLLLPEWRESYPLRVLGTQGMPIRNMGRGCAFDIGVNDWYIGAQGKRRVHALQVDREFLQPNGELHLRSLFGQPPVPDIQPDEGEIGVAVLHYKDFCAGLWHTTWNTDPRTGRPTELRVPTIWNEEKWRKHPHLIGLCNYCTEDAKLG